jgi:hypothetical protein
MNNKLKENRPILLFSLVWFVVNLVQAYFTEIHVDEAYYWVFSEFPDWGYFDHPPIIAMLVKLGYAIFPNELGVRLFPSLLGAGTIFFTYKLLPREYREIRLFILVVSTVSLMHVNVAGFLALPDIPLAFFASLYFLVMKRYLSEDRLPQALLLGIIVALMMYSKYHAALILFFTLLADWRLLLRRTFWVIVVIAVILYIPHIIWQVKHDFVSFQYHLIGRNTSFQFRYIPEYLGNQLLVTGPFTGVLLLYLAFSRRTHDTFERMLKFILIGFFGFFLISSVRGHVEPHWTAAAFIPMLILAFMQLKGKLKIRKWLVILAYATIPVVVILRLYLIIDFLPFMPASITRTFHQQDTWVRQIEEVAGDRPVVFRNKFQYPSVYWFYSEKPAFTRNSMYYRRNQYDVWDMEHELRGKEVFLTAYGGNQGCDTLSTVYGNVYYYEIDSYCSFNNLKVNILAKNIKAVSGDTITLSVRIENPNEYSVCLDCPCDIPPYLVVSFMDNERNRYFARILDEPDLGEISPGEVLDMKVRIAIPAPPGSYRSAIAFTSGILNPGINGRVLQCEITDPLASPGSRSHP